MHDRTDGRPYRIIDAPSVLGLKPTGVEHLGERLLREGLAERLHAEVVARIDTPAYDPERDPETLTLNARAIAAWSPRLADAISAVLEQQGFPLVLGGDCSIVLGSMLALRRSGRFGLLFIDGHADFYQPEVNPNGEAASMDLAFATGHGPELLTNIEGLRPLVRETDVCLFGFRDGEEQKQYGSQPVPPDLRAFDLDAVRRLGIHEAARQAVEHLCRAELQGFFIHVDADCLDDAYMPAVDYRLAGGLSHEELGTVLEVALASGSAAGLEVTIYNPSLDQDGRAGKALTNTLVRVLNAP